MNVLENLKNSKMNRYIDKSRLGSILTFMLKMCRMCTGISFLPFPTDPEGTIATATVGSSALYGQKHPVAVQTTLLHNVSLSFMYINVTEVTTTDARSNVSGIDLSGSLVEVGPSNAQKVSMQQVLAR